MPVQTSFEARLEACVSAMLREEYPFTHNTIINDVARVTASYSASEIVARKKACKKGVRPLQFMELPAEIRNRIHEYTVSYCNEYHFDSSTKDDEIAFTKWSDGHAALQPPITKVSRQLRSETLEMFYATNRFVLALGHISRIELVQGNFRARKWLRAVGTVNAAYMKDFTIRYKSRQLPVSIEEVLAKTGLSLVAGIAKLESRR
ncbi:hypothetical protein LTR15_012175 [Elasticomyces elasticus]|nr:hypothetical protein LTR15_012175 [Elasticomyces elasticus]